MSDSEIDEYNARETLEQREARASLNEFRRTSFYDEWWREDSQSYQYPASVTFGVQRFEGSREWLKFPLEAWLANRRRLKAIAKRQADKR